MEGERAGIRAEIEHGLVFCITPYSGADLSSVTVEIALLPSAGDHLVEERALLEPDWVEALGRSEPRPVFPVESCLLQLFDSGKVGIDGKEDHRGVEDRSKALDDEVSVVPGKPCIDGDAEQCSEGVDDQARQKVCL